MDLITTKRLSANRAVDRAAWLAIREICCQRRADAQRFTIRPRPRGVKRNIEQAERMLKGLQVRQQK
jgi:hypothetical protein